MIIGLGERKTLLVMVMYNVIVIEILIKEQETAKLFEKDGC